MAMQDTQNKQKVMRNRTRITFKTKGGMESFKLITILFDHMQVAPEKKPYLIKDGVKIIL